MKHEKGHGCQHHDHDHDHDHRHDHDCGSSLTKETDARLTEVYAGQGVQFHYPRRWSVLEESSEEQTTITVQSPGTTYWTLSLFEGRPDPDRIVNSVMSAYRDSYPDLDVYESDVQVMGAPAVARELDFLCLDLVSTASLVVFQTLNHTVLVTFQGEDRELETTRPVLESITRSLLLDLD